jgi:hypothetical protein
VRRKAGPWGYDQQTRYEAVGRIEAPAGGLGIVKEFEYLKAHTTRHVKATCAGPLTFGSRIHPGKTYTGVVDVAERFAEVINAELKGLVEAGADFIIRAAHPRVLEEEGEGEEWEEGDSREEKGECEAEGEASIANGPTNSLNCERLKSPFGFLEKLSKLTRPEIELSLFSRELPMLKDG